MGQAQTDVLRIVALSKILPGHVCIIVKNLGNIARTYKLCEAFPIEQAGACGSQEWRVRRGSHVGHVGGELDVFRMPGQLIVAYQATIWLATERTVFFFVDLLEDRSLFPIVLLGEIP